MRTELIPRAVEPARASAANAYRKAPNAPVAEKKGDTVELSAEAKRRHAAHAVESELEKAVKDKIQSLKGQFSSGSLSYAGKLDAVMDRLLAVI